MKLGRFSKLARSHNLFIDFLNVSVLSDTVVYSAIPYEKIKAYMFLRRSLASLARAYKLPFLYMIFFFFFFYVGTFGGLPSPPPPPPPPRIPKSWLRYCCQLSLTRRVAKWRWPIPSSPPPPPPPPPPPHSLHEIAATDGNWYYEEVYDHDDYLEKG